MIGIASVAGLATRADIPGESLRGSSRHRNPGVVNVPGASSALGNREQGASTVPRPGYELSEAERAHDLVTRLGVSIQRLRMSRSGLSRP